MGYRAGRRGARTGRVLLLTCALVCVAVTARAESAEVRVHRGSDDLLVDVSAHDLVDDDVRRALLSGLPARIRLRVELWAARSVLWDELVATHESEARIVYTLLDEHFDVLDESGRTVFSTADAEAVANWVQQVRGLPLCAFDTVRPRRRHYVTAEFRLDPLTVEELKDLHRWLSGTLTGIDERSSVERLSGQLLGLVKGKIGLGDRRRGGRSADFRAETLPPPEGPR